MVTIGQNKFALEEMDIVPRRKRRGPPDRPLPGKGLSDSSDCLRTVSRPED